MLLVGFGFLMVFVRNYGYSATTGTYLVVAAGLAPCTCGLRVHRGSFRPEASSPQIPSSLSAAGRIRVRGGTDFHGGHSGTRPAFINMRCWPSLAVPAYLLNEWLVLDGGLGMTRGVRGYGRLGRHSRLWRLLWAGIGRGP